MRAIDDLQMLRIHLPLAKSSNSCIPRAPVLEAPIILCAFTLQMQIILDDENLRSWVNLMQLRTCFLPFVSHPPLAMARGETISTTAMSRARY